MTNIHEDTNKRIVCDANPDAETLAIIRFRCGLSFWTDHMIDM